MVNYHGKFIKNLSQLSDPLRLLEKKHVAWHWGRDQEAAFEEIKK